jgi:hypothetical protein
MSRSEVLPSRRCEPLHRSTPGRVESFLTVPPTTGDNSAINAIPHIIFHGEYRLAVYHPTGLLDEGLAARLLNLLLAMENADPEPFDRLLDLAAGFSVRVNVTEHAEYPPR